MKSGQGTQFNGSDRVAGARKLLEVCASVAPGDEVLIIYDEATEAVARPLASAAIEIEAIPVLVRMEQRSRDGEEPPAAIAAAMKAAAVFLTPVTRSITHTLAVREAVLSGSRGLVMTQWRAEMLTAGGIEADFPAIAPQCRRLAEAFESGSWLAVRAPGGTDLRMEIQGRRGNAMTCMVKPGEFSPIPTIEANVSPIEGSAQGVIVADVSIPYAEIGILEEPVVAEVSDGFVAGIRGGSQADRLAKILRSFSDPLVFNFAELGVGMNPKAKLCGIMLEDEAVAGTAHIGIGTSITLGGTVKAASHYDLLFDRPTIEVDGAIVVRDGAVVA